MHDKLIINTIKLSHIAPAYKQVFSFNTVATSGFNCYYFLSRIQVQVITNNSRSEKMPEINYALHCLFPGKASYRKNCNENGMCPTQWQTHQVDKKINPCCRGIGIIFPDHKQGNKKCRCQNEIPYPVPQQERLYRLYWLSGILHVAI